MLKGESLKKLSEEKGLGETYIIASIEKVINDILDYATFIRSNKRLVQTLQKLIDELVEKRNEEQKEEICDGTLVKKKRLETKDYKPFVYPNEDTPENEEELMEEDWEDTDGNGDENIGE